ncbi:sorting nexin-17-like protein [Leptotrombidium deliense]|uniref:Sorting nexin-17-like protein n=1 Tax=Leptotrombidium deliense TaxID=299467 RepID=A0A443SD39_9ACAR|nr:sorting nexin-17-like protein [Leptotrombidium deliense]
MHFSIPETLDLKDERQNTFCAYNIHINGSFHCTVRYKQLHSFHEQLKKAFGHSCLPIFPPKKLLPLTQPQIEERRSQLEKYIQLISQDQKIVNSDFFNAFLLNAQHESQSSKAEQTSLDVYVMNWHRVRIQVLNTCNSAAVLETVFKSLNLSLQYLPYFCLYLVNNEETKYFLVRKLQNFEAPFLSLKTANNNRANKYFLVVRKCYWDSSYDEDLFEDETALDLLYGQTVFEVERGWISTTKETRKHLNSLQAKGSKREYVSLAQTQRFYGYLQFEPCLCNYPQLNTSVVIRAGGSEMVISIDETKEFSFRVTRIRCWRLIASPVESVNGCCSDDKNRHTKFELSFEYLLMKDVLKWITINSEQAILISMCLRGMVEELLLKKQGVKFADDSRLSSNSRRGSWSYMKRDGSSHQIAIPKSVSTDSFVNGNSNHTKNRKFHSKPERKTRGRSLVENDAFDGIGDDDL